MVDESTAADAVQVRKESENVDVSSDQEEIPMPEPDANQGAEQVVMPNAENLIDYEEVLESTPEDANVESAGEARVGGRARGRARVSSSSLSLRSSFAGKLRTVIIFLNVDGVFLCADRHTASRFP